MSLGILDQVFIDFLNQTNYITKSKRETRILDELMLTEKETEEYRLIKAG